MVRESDEQLRDELVKQYKGMSLYNEDADMRMRLEMYEDVREIRAMLRQLVDNMSVK